MQGPEEDSNNGRHHQLENQPAAAVAAEEQLHLPAHLRDHRFAARDDNQRDGINEDANGDHLENAEEAVANQDWQDAVELQDVSHHQQQQPLHQVGESIVFDSIESLCPRDPCRMELTNEEHQWALAIKAAIESSPEIDNLSDFQYAQYALVDQDNIQSAVDRALHYQFFREQYRVRDTYEDGCYMSLAFCRMMPETLLSITHYRDRGNFICVADVAKVNDKLIVTEEDERVFAAFFYYLFHALSPDFTAIRNGIILVSECDGYNWKNLTLKTRQKLWRENGSVYPIKLNQVKYFHTGLFANLAISILKRMLPEHLSSKIQVGCQFPGRLDTFYNTPTCDIAQHRVQERLKVCLKRRFENEASFSLG